MQTSTADVDSVSNLLANSRGSVMDFQARVERLERENRNFKKAALLLVAIGMAGVLVGAGQSRPQAIDVVQSKKFQLVNDDGTVLSEWTSSKDGDGGYHSGIAFGKATILNDIQLLISYGGLTSQVSPLGMELKNSDNSYNISMTSFGFDVSNSTGANPADTILGDGFLHLQDHNKNLKVITPTSTPAIETDPRFKLPRRQVTKIPKSK